MLDIKKIDEGLYRLYVPFEELLTAVFFVVSTDGAAIIDSATFGEDADNYIVPALEVLNIACEDVKCIALTHKHADHAGGAGRLAELLPNAAVYSPEPVKTEYLPVLDGNVLPCGIRAVALAGHTSGCVGYVHEASGTLLSGDCLQLFGIGKYRNGVGYPELYERSVERVRGMELRRIVASHEYDPLGSEANGKNEIEKYLDTCLLFFKKEK